MGSNKEPINISFFNEKGEVKSKEEFLNEIEEIYDSIATDDDQGDCLMDLLMNPEYDFEPEHLMEKFQFLERKIYIVDEINSEMSTDIVARIQYWNREDEYDEVPVDEREPIHIYIDTPGGVVSAAMSIIDAIQASKTPVYTIVTGTAYSCGFFITIAGHKRYGYKHSTYLFHEGSAIFGGDAHKVCQQSEFYRKIVLKQIKALIVDSTGIDIETYEKHYKDDWYFDAEKAKSLNVIDEIIKDDVNGGSKE